MTSPFSTGRRGVQFGGGLAQRTAMRGADDFFKLSKALKAAGQTGLRNEMHAAMRRAGKPLPKLVKQAAREQLPKQGGLNERIAKRTPKVVTRTGARTAGVRVQDTKTDPRISLEGRIWHPIFGRKGPNVDGKKNSTVTRVPGSEGYFEESMREAAPAIRADMIAVLEQFAERILAEAKGR